MSWKRCSLGRGFAERPLRGVDGLNPQSFRAIRTRVQLFFRPTAHDTLRRIPRTCSQMADIRK